MILPLKNMWKFKKWFCGLGFNERGYHECIQYQSSWDNRTSHYRYLPRDIGPPTYEGIQIIWYEGNLFGLKHEER